MVGWLAGSLHAITHTSQGEEGRQQKKKGGVIQDNEEQSTTVCPAGHLAFDPAYSLSSLLLSLLFLLPLLLFCIPLCDLLNPHPVSCALPLPCRCSCLLLPAFALFPHFPSSPPSHTYTSTHTSLLAFSIDNKLLHHFYEYNYPSSLLSLSLSFLPLSLSHFSLTFHLATPAVFVHLPSFQSSFNTTAPPSIPPALI